MEIIMELLMTILILGYLVVVGVVFIDGVKFFRSRKKEDWKILLISFFITCTISYFVLICVM